MRLKAKLNKHEMYSLVKADIGDIYFPRHELGLQGIYGRDEFLFIFDGKSLLPTASSLIYNTFGAEEVNFKKFMAYVQNRKN